MADGAKDVKMRCTTGRCCRGNDAGQNRQHGDDGQLDQRHRQPGHALRLQGRDDGPPEQDARDQALDRAEQSDDDGLAPHHCA